MAVLFQTSDFTLQIFTVILGAVTGYVIGAIPIGLLIGLSRGVDVGEHGSKKIGATNVQRTLGSGPALIVLLGDIGKGVLAVLAAWWLAGWLWPGAGVADTAVGLSLSAAALASVLGHSWSIFVKLLRDRWDGGRGVATGGGTIMIMQILAATSAGAAIPVAGIAGILTLLAVTALTRYVSLGSILGTLTGTVIFTVYIALSLIPPIYLIYTILLAFLIIVRHHDNIGRLLAGTERKFGQPA